MPESEPVLPSMKSVAGRRAWLDALRPSPKRDDETSSEWTNRINREGAAIGKFRQCSIGWHDECSNPDGDECRCVCHMADTPSYLDLAKWAAITWDEADAAVAEAKLLRGKLYDAIMSPSDDPEMFEVDLNHDIGEAIPRTETPDA